MGLKFSLEFGSDKINFLDLIIINNNNWLSLIGHKSMFLEKIFKLFIFTSTFTKKGIIIGIIQLFCYQIQNIIKKISCILSSTTVNQ